MRKTALYIAMSLDGFIADRGGGVDWLTGQDPSAGAPDSYDTFIRDMDTVIMGWNTYHQITTELSPDKWVYSGLTSFVITHRSLPSTEEIRFVRSDPCSLVRRLKQEPGRGIWICGGASIAQPLTRAGLIDEYDVSVIPTLLGSGVRLWGELEREEPLRLTRTQTRNGITELVYTLRRPAGPCPPAP